eukprot:TRINITY_DN27230_c0_g1_i1.p1 TRINITY_DN27230_c0_g1~~TRINITY_DN27230_c0_g1_i1.p1  ORF type:complete len:705 (-),score=284.53 TRINITY_DN27230_c0_g1_i1:252-2366(-)
MIPIVSALVELIKRRKKQAGSAAAVGVLTYLLYRKFRRAATKREVQKRPAREPLYKLLLPLLKIVLPRVRCKETAILALHTSALLARTFLSVYVAQLDGRIVKSIVDRKGKEFLWLLVLWVGFAIPASYTNSMIRYLESKLAIAFRTRLTEYAYEMYMSNETYYRAGNLDSRLANPDQCLTEDIARFCAELAHVHSQLSKPLLDIVLMTAQLIRMNSARGRAGISSLLTSTLGFGVVIGTGRLLKLAQPPFSKMVAHEAKLAGELRYVHSRLITNAEEVAFYRGHKIEKNILQEKYHTLVRHMNFIFHSRVVYNMLESFFMKYVWSVTGLAMIAIPAFLYEERGVPILAEAGEVSRRTEEFVTSKKLLINVSEAAERVVLAYKEVQELAGLTARVSEMIRVFQEVKEGKYQKTMISRGKGQGNQSMALVPRGRLSEDGFVKFQDVPIISPNGDELIKSLSFEVQPGMHVLITGPNGCGKSSLFRILGGLWPVHGGVVSKPRAKDMFYIPQRPYLVIGTLRDQIIYPDSRADMIAKGISDKDLEQLLGIVSLLPILERESGWDARNEWQDVLSGGEKQRVGMARLFYHKPKFAILDECTSAVSIDVEGKMYQHAIDLGITLLTVTHRPSLWKYHEYLLQFDGEGGWNFSKLNSEARLSLKEEKIKLEAQLQGVPKMHKRLKELSRLLGEDSVALADSTEEDEASD